MTAEERMVADLTDIRCLLLCIAVLERVNGVRISLKLILYPPVERNINASIVF